MRVIPPLTVTEGATFTRSTTATYYDDDGLIASAAINALRISYDPTDLDLAPSALIEPAGTNLLLRSEDITHAAWNQVGALAITANAGVAPDGATTADLVQNPGSDDRYIWQAAGITPDTGWWTYSVFLKAGDAYSTVVEVQVFNGPAISGLAAEIVWSDGSLTVYPGVGTYDAPTLQELPNGWFRLSISLKNDGTGPFLSINVHTAGYLTANPGSCYVWGAQIESGRLATSYIPTAGSTVTRAADVVTGSGLVYSNAPEPGVGETVWNAATNWATGSTVYLAANHTRYERLSPGGVDATSPHLDDGTRWLELGPTNRWAIFDLLRNTGTVLASPLDIVLAPGQRADSLALVGMVADSANVQVVSGGEVVFNETINLSTRDSAGWYDYFTLPFTYKTAIAHFDLPPITDAVITVHLERASGDVTLGGLIFGRSVYLGDTQYSPESDALNFSVVERDEFGNSQLVPRRNVPKISPTLWTRKALVNRVLAVRNDLNARPALWSGLDDADSGYFEALLILGYYRRFTISLDHPDVAVVSLELEEV